MIGNDLEQEIIGLYIDDISSLYSINQIATSLGKKYPYINKKVTNLIQNKIFKKTIIGRSHLCSLNLSNDETVYLLILAEIRKKKKALEKNPSLNTLLEYIHKAKRVVSIHLAIMHQKKLMFVLEDEKEKEQLNNAFVKQAAQGYQIEMYTKESFSQEILKNKELQEQHTILLGYEKYYEYVKNIEDELKLKYSKLIP